MPIYEYECRHCGDRFEVTQSINDKPLKRCSKCEGVLMKVFHPVGVVFKGNGFYITDNRKKANGDKGIKKAEAKKEEAKDKVST
ncbi:MAG: FmdB family zinc ribbon protein [bacterium]